MKAPLVPSSCRASARTLSRSICSSFLERVIGRAPSLLGTRILLEGPLGRAFVMLDATMLHPSPCRQCPTLRPDRGPVGPSSRAARPPEESEEYHRSFASSRIVGLRHRVMCLSTPTALYFVLLVFGGWVNREQRKAIDYLLEENRVLREQLGSRCVRLDDNQRRRLAIKGKAVGRKVLHHIAGIVTPDTILRWYRRLTARSCPRILSMARWNCAGSRRLRLAPAVFSQWEKGWDVIAPPWKRAGSGASRGSNSPAIGCSPPRSCFGTGRAWRSPSVMRNLPQKIGSPPRYLNHAGLSLARR